MLFVQERNWKKKRRKKSIKRKTKGIRWLQMPRTREKVNEGISSRPSSRLFLLVELKNDAQKKGKTNIWEMSSENNREFSSCLAGDLKDQASQKADQAKDKANEVAADAKNKGQGKLTFTFSSGVKDVPLNFLLEIKNDVQRKGKELIFFITSTLFVRCWFVADEAQANSNVHISSTGTAHNVSASHDTSAPHGQSSAAKIEVKTTGTNKPPLA